MIERKKENNDHGLYFAVINRVQVQVVDGVPRPRMAWHPGGALQLVRGGRLSRPLLLNVV